MAILLSILALPAYATYHPPAPANNSDWDLLYVAAGLMLYVAIVVTAAVVANSRDERRNPRTH